MPKDLTKDLEKQIVHTTSLFKKDEEFTDERFMRVRVAMMHSGINRNKSRFTKEVIENARDTFANIPVLADVVKHTDENGNTYLDYSTHSMHIETDEFDKDSERMIYDEKVVGIVPETNNFELILDDETGNYYAYVDALLYRDYGNYACDILESRGGETDVSMEISCDDVSFSAKDKCLDVGVMTACAVTLLGSDVTPGMAKAHATTFSINTDTKQEQLIQIMQELKESLDNYTKSTFAQDNDQKGGKTQLTKFEELLEKYGKSVDDIEFEYEGLSDEELEQKFAEVFGENDADGEGNDDGENPEDGTDDTPDGEDGNDEDTSDESDDNEDDSITDLEACKPKKKKKCSEEKMEISYEISHDDIRYALYNLISQYEELDNEYYYISAVYDDKFIMEGWNGSIYGQKYTKDGDNVALDGERYVLYREYITESEKAELESMRANYSSISEKLAKYEAAEAEAQKSELLASKDYSSIADKAEFVEVSKDASTYSVDELKSKLDEILLSYAKAGNLSFASTEEVKKEVKVTRLPLNDGKTAKRSRYGSLFSKSN